VWYTSQKGAGKSCSFKLSREKIFSNYDQTRSKEEKNKTKAKRGHIAGNAYNAGHGGRRAISK